MKFQGHFLNPSTFNEGKRGIFSTHYVENDFKVFFPLVEVIATHFIEFAFESVVVDIIGDVLQLAMLVEIDNGVVSESIDDFAVV